MGENLALGLFVLLTAASLAVCLAFARWLKHRNNRAGFGGLVLGNLLVLIFLLSVIVLSGEIYCRFCRDTTDSLNYTKASVRWFERHWQTNSAGCRDDLEYAVEIPRGRRRITFVGDSFTAAQGVKNIEDRFGNI